MPTISFLFVDQVGSTAQLDDLGDVATFPLRQTLFDIFERALRSHGGTQVDNTGDGIMAAFDSAVDAVECAATIQRSVSRHNRDPSVAQSLEVRAGIHVGEPLVDETGRFFGMAVVVAARLCAAAQGDQVLVSDLVRALCASRPHLQFSTMGAFELKGVGQPVPAHELILEVDVEPLLPLPDALAMAGRLDFVGRASERAALERAWEVARSGTRRLVLISGEAGIGKTRLVAEVARAAHVQGALVLFGRCDDEIGFPYQPFIEAMRHVVRTTPGAQVPARLGRYAGELRRLLPELAYRTDLPAAIVSDPETERYRLFDAIATCLAALAAEAPVMLIVDDLHWASAPTVQLLRFIARSLEVTRLCLLVTYRHDELGREHPLRALLADLRQATGVERVRLNGLTEHDVFELLGTVGHGDAGVDDREVAKIIHAETDGNAFFVAEVLQLVRESGEELRQSTGGSSSRPLSEFTIPDSVREVLGRRLSRITDRTHDVLEVAAVAGPQLHFGVLGDALDLPSDQLLLAVDEAINAGILRDQPSGEPEFGHALIRTTLYDEISVARRIRLHRRVGEAIERVHQRRLDEFLAELAYHFVRARVGGDVEKAVEYSSRAGDRSLAQLAHDEATRYYRQALDLLDQANTPADAARARLLVALAEAQARAGDPASRDSMLEGAELARDIGDMELLATAALVRSRIGFGAVEADPARLSLLDEALATLPVTDSAIRARVLASLAEELAFGNNPRSEQLSAEAVAMARRLREPAVLAQAVHARFYGLLDPTTLAEKRLLAAEVARLAESLGDPRLTFLANFDACGLATIAADPDALDEHLGQVERLAADLGQPVPRWLAGAARVCVDTLTGNLEAAERRAGDVLAQGQDAGQPDAFLIYAAQLFTIRLHQGRLHELEHLFQAVETSVRLPAVEPTRALLEVETGRREEARARLARLADDDFGGLPNDPLLVLALAAAAWAVADLGERRWAEVLESQLLPYQGLAVSGGAVWWGPVDRYLALLSTTRGLVDEASERFARAASVAARMRAEPWLARIQIEWADLLERRHASGDADQAAALRRDALEVARRRGLTTIAQRAQP